jgi:hypothetical protein
MFTDRVARRILFVANAACAFQLFWFARYTFNQIDYDGMAYVGIARHIHEGRWSLAINAFRSPLISWLIAAFSNISAKYLLWGKLVTVGSYLLCLILTYFLTENLWQSKVTAAVAVLLFTLARGVSSTAVSTVSPDFLFAALVLLYFIVLLRCLRGGGLSTWFLLGGIHGVAFLAKGFALPWLLLCTVLAVVLAGKPWRQAILRLVLAISIPLAVAAGWGSVLQSKYGTFTTGSQFRLNLLQWTLDAFREHPETKYAVLTDTTKTVDEYGVEDPMPPGSWPWKYRITAARAISKIAAAEVRLVPMTLKELVILVTPGGILAFVAIVFVVVHHRARYPVEWRFIAIVVGAALSLIFAYSMLVFVSRYLFPLIPLLLAVASRFLIPGEPFVYHRWRRACLIFVALGLAASMIYKSSPFRTLTRDFQVSCYDAGGQLIRHSGSTLASVGSGPFPDYGVGWEAGYKAAYFGNRRIIGTSDRLPRPDELGALIADLRKASPKALIVWGRTGDLEYQDVIEGLGAIYQGESTNKLIDPLLGEVGVVLYPRREFGNQIAYP